MKCSLESSNFLEEISGPPYSICLLYFFTLFFKELISPCYSLELYFQLGISIPFSLAFCFSFLLQLFEKALQTTILPSCISFSLWWFWLLLPVQYYKPLPIVLQGLSLPDLIPRIYSSPPLYHHKLFDLGHT